MKEARNEKESGMKTRDTVGSGWNATDVRSLRPPRARALAAGLAAALLGFLPIQATALDTVNDRCTGGIATGSTAAGVAFDDNTGTKWYTPVSTGWIAYQFGGMHDHHQLHDNLGQRCGQPRPEGLDLQGSHDGLAWTVVDTRSGIPTWPSRSQTLAFDCSGNTTGYEYYKLNITANNGAGDLQLAEIEMFGYAPIVDLPKVGNANGATNVASSSASLNGTLISTGTRPRRCSCCGDKRRRHELDRLGAHERMGRPPEHGNVFLCSDLAAHEQDVLLPFRRDEPRGAKWAFSTTNFITETAPVFSAGGDSGVTNDLVSTFAMARL